MPPLSGRPSDEVPGILATGRSGVAALFVSMSARHPEGRDADYLAWHTLDHRPEQYRLASLRTSLRFASTPACRAARAVSSARYDALDHLMTYFFADLAGLEPFVALSDAIRNAGRTPYLLPLVERAVYRVSGAHAAPRIKVGADVLPWWPATGVYLLVERGEAPAPELTEVPGVGGAWWASGAAVGPPYASADNAGLQLTYCFLDGDPVETAARLRPYLEKRWAGSRVVPLLAGPFRSIVPYEWDRALP